MQKYAKEFGPLTLDCSCEYHSWAEGRLLGKRAYLMWTYEKRLQYPVKISKTCPKTAQLIISQFGGLTANWPPL